MNSGFLPVARVVLLLACSVLAFGLACSPSASGPCPDPVPIGGSRADFTFQAPADAGFVVLEPMKFGEGVDEVWRIGVQGTGSRRLGCIAEGVACPGLDGGVPDGSLCPKQDLETFADELQAALDARGPVEGWLRTQCGSPAVWFNGDDWGVTNLVAEVVGSELAEHRLGDRVNLYLRPTVVHCD